MNKNFLAERGRAWRKIGRKKAKGQTNGAERIEVGSIWLSVQVQ